MSYPKVPGPECCATCRHNVHSICRERSDKYDVTFAGLRITHQETAHITDLKYVCGLYDRRRLSQKERK